MEIVALMDEMCQITNGLISVCSKMSHHTINIISQVNFFTTSQVIPSRSITVTKPGYPNGYSFLSVSTKTIEFTMSATRGVLRQKIYIGCQNGQI